MNAPVLELGHQVDRRRGRSLAPALDGDHAVLGVDTGDDVVGVRRHGRLAKRRVTHERAAEHETRRPCIQIALERLHAANAAADLDLDVCLAGDARDDVDVRGCAIARAIEVDDVDALRAGILEEPCLRDGILVVDGHLRVIALLEAHRAPVEYVDCGDENHLLPAVSSRILVKSTFLVKTSNSEQLYAPSTILPKFSSSCNPR